MHILLIEYDQKAAQTLEMFASGVGHVMVTIDLGDDAVAVAKDTDFDLILIGTTPDMTSNEIMRAVRMAGIRTPAIVLSTDPTIHHKVALLNNGADDIILRPFDLDELYARIQAIVRRSKGFSQNILQVGRLALNLDTQICTIDGQKLHITGREWQILELMAMRNGNCVTKEMILDNIYGGMDEPDPKIVDVFICKIRRKLMAYGLGEMIETVWGRGYKLRNDLDVLAEPLAEAA